MAEKKKTFAIFLRESRTKLGLSQVKMAEKIGVPFRTYQCWEYGNRNPKPLTESGARAKVKELLEEV